MTVLSIRIAVEVSTQRLHKLITNKICYRLLYNHLPDKFESPAERAIFAVMNTIAIQYKLDMKYQKKFGIQSGGYDTREEFCNDNGHSYNGDDSSWGSELYRGDYCYEGDNVKIIIEIDGEEFHQDKKHDRARDDYLNNKGYNILHFPAKWALREDYRIRKVIEYTIFLSQLSNFSTVGASYFSTATAA